MSHDLKTVECAPATKPGRLALRVRRRVWVAASLLFLAGIVTRVTMPAELPDDLFNFATGGFSATETAALSIDLPRIDKISKPPEIHPDGIKGSLVIIGGGKTPDIVRSRFLELGGDKRARLVIIPSASEDATVEMDGAWIRRLFEPLQPASIDVLHTRSRAMADSAEFCAPLEKATAVWISGGKQTLLAAAYSETRVEKELHGILERGGVIGGTSAGAACMSKLMIVRLSIFNVPGFGLLPGTIIDQHFAVRARKPRLAAALKKYPAWVGIGVDEQTALIVRGKKLECFGNSTVTLCLAPSESQPEREVVLNPGETADLIEWRRDALARLDLAETTDQAIGK